jgi:hypothetical protein
MGGTAEVPAMSAMPGEFPRSEASQVTPLPARAAPGSEPEQRTSSAPRPRPMAVLPGGSPAVVARRTPWVVARLVQLVWTAAFLLDAILVLDFVFRLIGSVNIGFVHATYVVGSTVAGPFVGIFAQLGHPGGLVLTWSDAVALVLYTIGAGLLVRLLLLARRPMTVWPR